MIPSHDQPISFQRQPASPLQLSRTCSRITAITGLDARYAGDTDGPRHLAIRHRVHAALPSVSLHALDGGELHLSRPSDEVGIAEAIWIADAVLKALNLSPSNSSYMVPFLPNDPIVMLDVGSGTLHRMADHIVLRGPWSVTDLLHTIGPFAGIREHGPVHLAPPTEGASVTDDASFMNRMKTTKAGAFGFGLPLSSLS